MNTLKNIMRKVLVAVLSLAMTFTVAPNAGLEVYAEEGYGAWAGIYFGGSNAYYQSEHPEEIQLKVALYADGVKQQEYDFTASTTEGSLNVDNLKEINDTTGEKIVYTWKVVNRTDIPEGFVVRIEKTNDGNNVLKFYCEGEIETETDEAGETVPVKDPVTGEDKLITFDPADFENFENGENGENGQNGENGENGENGQNGENGENGENGQNGENSQKGENNQNDENVDNKDNKDNKDSDATKDADVSKDSKDGKDSKSASKADGPAVGTKVKDRIYTYEIIKQASKDGKIVGEVAVTGIRDKSIKKIKLAKTGVFDGLKYKVTTIKANAFKGNKKVTKAIISRNIKKIGNGAFAKMKNLKKVLVTSRKLRTIGKKAFAGDKKLRSFNLKSKKLKRVGKNAFKGVSKKCVLKVVKSKKKVYSTKIKKAGFKGKIK